MKDYGFSKKKSTKNYSTYTTCWDKSICHFKSSKGS